MSAIGPDGQSAPGNRYINGEFRKYGDKDLNIDTNVLEETPVEQTTIREGNYTKSIGRHSTARALK